MFCDRNGPLFLGRVGHPTAGADGSRGGHPNACCVASSVAKSGILGAVGLVTLPPALMAVGFCSFSLFLSFLALCLCISYKFL